MKPKYGHWVCLLLLECQFLALPAERAKKRICLY